MPELSALDKLLPLGTPMDLMILAKLQAVPDLELIRGAVKSVAASIQLRTTTTVTWSALVIEGVGLRIPELDGAADLLV